MNRIFSKGEFLRASKKPHQKRTQQRKKKSKQLQQQQQLQQIPCVNFVRIFAVNWMLNCGELELKKCAVPPPV